MASRPMSSMFFATTVADTQRRYAASGAVWGLIAALLLVYAVLGLGSGACCVTAYLGVGRLAAGYVFVLIWGALSLPVAGAVLRIHWPDGLEPQAGRHADGAMWCWNVGVALGLGAALLGLRTPGSWGGAPWWALAFLLVGALLWCAVLWRGLRSRGDLPVSAWFALGAGVVLLTSLALGLAASRPLDGVPRAIADTMHGRLAVGAWLPLAVLSVAAVALPSSVGRPLYSRRTVWWGLWLWFALSLFLAGTPMAADLLPGWLVRPTGGAGVLVAVPAVLLAVGFLGAFVGQPIRLPRDTAPRMLALAAAGIFAAALAAAAATPWATDAMQFTAAQDVPGLLPPMAALLLAGVGASYAFIDERRSRWLLAPRYHLPLALAAGLLSVAPVWPLALAEASTGPSQDLLRAGLVARAPGALLVLASMVVWVANTWPRAGLLDTRPIRAIDGDSAARKGASAVAIAGISAVIVSGVLFVVLFLPLVDPAVGQPSARAGVRDLIPGSLAAIGRDRYVADGCDACHTQRVRQSPIDVGLGPPMAPGDHVYGPALVGFRRAGPDLGWVGDRHADRAAMADTLAVHGPGAVVALPWLVVADGPTSDGLAVVEYLIQLRSSREPSP